MSKSMKSLKSFAIAIFVTVSLAFAPAFAEGGDTDSGGGEPWDPAAYSPPTEEEVTQDEGGGWLQTLRSWFEGLTWDEASPTN